MSFDYDLLNGNPLRMALGCGAEGDEYGKIHYSRVILLTDQYGLLISVDINTDEIIWEIMDRKHIDTSSFANIHSLELFLGCNIGWSWSAENYQKFRDAVMISFSGLTPQIMFLGEGSMISILRLSRV